MTLPRKDIDYYELLLVSRKAPVEVIRASYRTLMQKLKHHPDLGGDVATAALINEAYAVLCHAERRAEYDAYLVAVQLAGNGVDFESTRSGTERSAIEKIDPHRACMFCGTEHEHGKSIAEATACSACRSPLFLAGNHKLELKGQRAVARIDKRQDIIFYTHWPQATGFIGRTEDISLNGMRFETRVDMQRGQYIKIVSQFADAIALVKNCRQMRRDPGVANVVGVSFVTLRIGQSRGGFVSEKI